ncbi:MAG: lysophospholipid acyltransferase family protein [Pseudomonadota bacterium]
MSIFDKDTDPLNTPEAIDRHIERALATNIGPGLEVDLAYRAVQKLFSPLVFNAGRIPQRPCLFIGNHSLFAFDGAVLAPVFRKQLKRFPWSMGDRFLFANRLSAEVLMRNGVVMGHPEVCAALMQAERDLILFPGGAYEAVKSMDRMYQLQWKERYGFVRLAAEHGYTIMPFGLVGPDEFYDHLIEGEDLPDSRIGRLLRKLGILHDDIRSDILPPIPVGALGSLMPKPQRCYLGFGEPIDLSTYRGKKLRMASLKKIRQQVAAEIEAQLEELLDIREETKDQDSWLRKVLTL